MENTAELTCEKCGHCVTCLIIRRDARYEKVFGVTAEELGGKLEPVSRPAIPETLVCKYRSEDKLSNHVAAKLGLPTVYNWYDCSHPNLPLGLFVCPCKGCHSGCKGFDSVKAETIV